MQRTRGASLIGDADKTSTTGRRRIGVLLSIAAIIAVLDQATKILAVEYLADDRVVPVIGEFIELRLHRNPGAAFSLATNATVLLAIVMIAVIVAILYMSRKLVSLPWAIALAGMLGGAIGNLGDRLFRAPGPLQGHVVDFLATPWWVGNVADAAIVGGAAMIAVLSLRGITYDGSRSAAATRARPDDADRAE
ncbi:MAG TPA: signal peptidase II [Jiangellaceae bacterium]